jgi:hypothetical protein
MQERLHDLAPMAQLMATSEQMLAYRMGLSVPPSLAMTSRKRFKSGGLKPKRLAKLVLESNPDIVVLSNRWPKQARRRIERGMRTSHRRVLRSWKGRMVYIRRSSRREQDSR